MIHVYPLDVQRQRGHDAPMDLSFSEFLQLTKPGPQKRCPTCETWSLRRYSETGEPEDEKVICTNQRCSDSPFFESGRRS